MLEWGEGPHRGDEEVGTDKMLVIGDIKLNKKEKTALLLNPKYGVFGEIIEEEVQKEIGGVKTRWDMMSNEEQYEEPANHTANELLETPEDECATEAEARTRQIFYFDSNTIKFPNKRATDYG